MHAWACRANMNIKKKNRKAEMEGTEIEPEKMCTEAPPGSTANAQLELPIVKKHHGHAFLQASQRAAENDAPESDNEEDGRFTSIASSLKKRKAQRKEQKDRGKKRRGTSSGGGDQVRINMQFVFTPYVMRVLTNCNKERRHSGLG